MAAAQNILIQEAGTIADVAALPGAVVALSSARDQYQLPLALDEAGLLHALVTDHYWPADKKWFQQSLGHLIPRELISRRFRPGLRSTKVTVPAIALGASTLMKAAPGLDLGWLNGVSLGRKARQLAGRNESALFCYSTCASEAFKLGANSSPFRFLFQLHPHPKAVRSILMEETERVPSARSSLQMEWELSLSGDQFCDLCSEPELANGWVVSSRFSARTLCENGAPADRVHVVPYGVDTSTFYNRRTRAGDRPLTALFVGSLIQRKGLSYLLDSARLLKSRNIRVVLCGRGFVDRTLLNRYSDLTLEIRQGLATSELVRVMNEADVLVLPSLAEGFGHVVLEAMACGLPVITTRNTCGPDVMTDGVHGFLVPLRDAAAIAEKLAWSLDHRDELFEMGNRAAAHAAAFTWERFRAGVRAAYGKMVDSVRIQL